MNSTGSRLSCGDILSNSTTLYIIPKPQGGEHIGPRESGPNRNHEDLDMIHAKHWCHPKSLSNISTRVSFIEDATECSSTRISRRYPPTRRVSDTRHTWPWFLCFFASKAKWLQSLLDIYSKLTFDCPRWQSPLNFAADVAWFCSGNHRLSFETSILWWSRLQINGKLLAYLDW